MGKSEGSGTDRRRFLRSTAAGAFGLAAGTQPAAARATVAAGLPSSARVAKDSAAGLMADVAGSLGIECLAGGPGMEFSEESAVSFAHGYAAVQGVPMMVLAEGEAGILRAAPALRRALEDRAPVFMVAAMESQQAQFDLDGLMRSVTKWDARAATAGDFVHAAARAYSVAMTAPRGPVLIAATFDASAGTDEQLPVPVVPAPRIGEAAAVTEAARMLVDAERPLILAGHHARAQNAIDLLAELAEALQAPVESRGRLNFPGRHRLAGNGGPGYVPDVVLCLEADHAQTGAGIIRIGSSSRGNDDGAFAIAADAAAAMPHLIEAVKQCVTAGRARVMDARGVRLAAAHRSIRDQNVALARDAWEAGTVNAARIAAELWMLLEGEDWSLVSPQGSVENWPSRLWDMKTPYNAPVAVAAEGSGLFVSTGAAMANRKHGRVSLGIHTEQEFLAAPRALETAARYRIPLLTIVQSEGTATVDCARIATGFGVAAEGPIAEARGLAAAFRRGVELAKKGEPALLHVVRASMPS